MTTDKREELSMEQALFDTIVHGLRMRGWSRIDAEDEALARIERRRAKAPKISP